MVLKSILHGQMTEKIVSEVRPKRQKIAKSAFVKKAFFDHLAPWVVKIFFTTLNLRANHVI